MDAEVETELVKCSMKSSSRDSGSETVAVTGEQEGSRHGAAQSEQRGTADSRVRVYPSYRYQYIEVDANLLTR